ncbi:MAG: aminoacetone oxidase family FAD-binding enzyme [Bacteroidetes bacterium]|nr:MAG: aminoacetone oxidase family FAD-binding enzyme [Bacteroidota bacterium]
MKQYDVIIIGGGAAGFFAAINIAEQNPKLSIAILERGKEVLTKVKVSGGGRCNVTHAEFSPSELVKHYPRGEKELLGPFHTFMTGDTIDWFEKRGIKLKIEDDGRLFPVSNSSQTIIDCFLNEVKRFGISVLKNHSVKHISKTNNWFIETNNGDFSCEKLLVATGSNTKIWKLIQDLGHTIVDPVPSLFTFNIKDERIKNIPGVVAQNVSIKVLDILSPNGEMPQRGREADLESKGPLLITHWGMSAPAILKLSAFGALELAKRDYKFKIVINFIQISFENCLNLFKEVKQSSIKKTVINAPQFELPKRLWQQLVLASHISKEIRWQDLNKIQLEQLAYQLTKAVFSVDGKSTFKEEFVTAGGVDLKEVNFKTFESKLLKNLYFAGEILNIDAVTGGFNFQNAWTGAYIAAQHISK